MIDQAPEAATVHRGRLGQRHLVPELLPVRVKDRRIDRLGRWHAMLNYVNCGMLYDFRLCDLERFGAAPAASMASTAPNAMNLDISDPHRIQPGPTQHGGRIGNAQ